MDGNGHGMFIFKGTDEGNSYLNNSFLIPYMKS